MILVVDDNPMVRDVVQAMLKSGGHASLSAENGASALRVFESTHFDGAMVDMDMPGMNGIELCRELHRRTTEQHRPFVAWLMTGVVRPELVTAAVGAGATGVLAKPFTKPQLLACFSEAVMREAAEHPLAG